MGCLIDALRHSESEGNKAKIHQGQWPDAPGLTEKGRLQATRIAEYYQDKPLSGIWTSPLRRCTELAHRIAERHSEPVSVFFEDDLMEMSHGGADGLSFEEIQKTYPSSWKRWIKGRLEEDMPCFIGGETPLAVWERGHRVFKKVARLTAQSENPLDTALIVTHGTTLRFVILGIQGKKLKTPLRIDNGSLTTFQWEEIFLKVRGVNLTHHLGDLHEPSENPI